MTHDIQGVLADIDRELGPVLERLGLEPGVTYGKDEIRVGFVPKEGNTRFSPITVVFDFVGLPEWYDATWVHAYVEENSFSRRTLGETEWESWECLHTYRYKTRQSDVETLQWLRELVANEGVVPDGARTPNCIETPYVADLYRLLTTRFFDDVQIDQDVSTPGEVVESLSFVDDLGREGRFSMRAGDAHVTLFVDGEVFQTFEQDHVGRVRLVLRDLRNTPLSSQSVTP
ncbi:hypothetical protein [Rhizobium leguminosarum]|uniref:hypothetical protein n=1 Tax=Rhizobium leguminosarum TaxID=384 RepID=UPI001039EDEF|nr:hypothetical protein [Rhizobium leguminosarum]TBY27425.1 hypothetical protein E0H55_27425 [Rhizobium leguminosarum bv. viciae]